MLPCLNRSRLWLIVVVGAAGVCAGARAQTVWHVDDDACPSSGAGSELEPFCSIQAGIDAAADGDSILVAPGNYYEAIDLLGKAVTLLGTNGPEVTTIDATGLDTSVVTCANRESLDTVIEGFTITGGSGSPCATPYTRTCGGGMFLKDSSPRLRGCILTGNDAAWYGGGLYSNGGAPTVEDCVFQQNHAEVCGGGCYLANGGPSVLRTAFYANEAESGGGAYVDRVVDADFDACSFVGNQATRSGGGCLVVDSLATLGDCEFLGNRVDGYGEGAGLAIDGSVVTVERSTFHANVSGGWGGAIHNYDSTLDIRACDFGGNAVASAYSAEVGGGAIYNDNLEGAVSIADSRFYGNSAESGGAIDQRGGPLSLTNCLFVANRGHRNGGAISTVYSALSIVNSSFSNNNADFGGAIAQVYGCSPASYIHVANSILWNNWPLEIQVAAGCSLTIRSSDILGGVPDGAVDEGGNIDLDPQFKRRPVAGSGPQQILEPDYGDLRLNSGSPCVDAGDNQALPNGVVADLEGQPRLVDDPCTSDSGSPKAPIVDMGAYEFRPPSGCGDGLCDGDETCRTCVCDCGECCGDAVCAEYESCISCAGDCACLSRYVPDDYPSIQAAIDASKDGDQVLVRAGTYYGHVDFAGKTIRLRSTDGPATTILDGSRSYGSIVTCTGTHSRETLLEGFTITNGHAPSGGGMYNRYCSPTIRRCIFHRNVSLGSGLPSDEFSGGGAVYNVHSDPLIEHCLFTGNTAARLGGAILNWSLSSPTIVNSVFVANSAWFGGALYDRDGAPSVLYCSFSANDAYYAGGAIRSYRGKSTITGCGVWGNLLGGSAEWPESGIALVDESVVSYSNVQQSGGSADWGHGGNRVFGTDGGGNIDADPLFRRKPDDGSDGWGDNADTPGVDEGANEDFGDLRLRPGSPNIDAGDNAGVPEGVDTDFDGNARFIDDGCAADTGAGVPPLVDIGAYEFQTEQPCGNGTCDECETCSSCPLDCGPCCGNGVCSDSETCSNCPVDCGACCGNGVCALDESCLNCPDDCPCGVLRVPGRFATIQSAIDAARLDDVVEVAAGTYHESIDFLGKQLTVRSTSGPEVTTIDATGLDRAAVTIGGGTDEGRVLEGFTVTGGDVLTSFPGTWTCGGGTFVGASALTIRNCVYTRNAAFSGGGICVTRDGRVSLEKCVFSENVAAVGAGIYAYIADVSATDSVFARNENVGIYANDCTTRLTRCEFEGNREWGLLAYLGTSIVQQSMFRNNKATRGAGIECNGCTLQLGDTLFVANSASQHGGAVVASYGANVTISRCTISKNAAPIGAGISVYCNDEAGPCTVTVADSILWNDGDEIAVADESVVSVQYSDVRGGHGGFGNLGTAPLFARAPDDGGDGWGDDPETPDIDEGANDDYGDLRLEVKSPAMNAGDPTVAFVRGDHDLDGHTRVLCGRVDMGAYEFGIGDYNCDRIVSLDDFAAWNGCTTGPDSDLVDPACAAFDFNADGSVDLRDYNGWAEAYSKTR